MSDLAKGGKMCGETSEIEKDELEVELIWKRREDRKLTGGDLVGRLITEKNLNVPTVMQMIRKGWNLEKKEDLEIVEVDRRSFIFEFRRREDWLRILRGRPWSINGVMEVENTKRLGAKIGEVVLAEDPMRNGLLIRSFLRARVMVDLRKPLVTGLRTTRKEKDPIEIKVRYERLQNLCFACGRVGHDVRGCPKVNKDEDPIEMSYGTWLGVPAARRIDENIVICKEGWEEMVVGGRSEVQKVRGIEGRVDRSYKASAKGSNDKENECPAVKKLENETVKIRGEVDGGGNYNMKIEVEDSKRENVSEMKKDGKAEKRKYVKQALRRKEEMVEGSPGKNVDMTKAMVVYGSVSLMSEVVASLGKVGLKRRSVEVEEAQSSKRRKLMFDAMEVSNADVQVANMRKGGRRSVTSLKRQSRRMGGGVKMAVKVLHDAQILNENFIFSTEGDGGNDTYSTEGLGGWPSTATKAP